MRVPLVDLAWQQGEIAGELEEGFARVISSGAFVLGPDVEAFEDEFASYCGVARCVGVANGTDALELVLRACDLGPGDEVVVPAFTFVASALAVLRCGATPVFADVDPVHLLIDPERVAERVGERTRAVLAVDLYGQVAPMEALEALSGERGLLLVEDAAQAQGARRRSGRAGSFGVAAGTSFYPAKNLGAYGDAGAVVTSSEELAERVLRLRSYGSVRKYHHPEAGFNSRLDTLQAVVLRAKLRRLEAWNALRREAAVRYDALLADLEGVVPPRTLADNEHVYHLYVVRVADRDRVLAELQREGIGAGVHYPHALHREGLFAARGHRSGDFPIAERAAQEVLSLPLYPGITAEQQERVAATLRDALRRSGRAA